MTTKTRNAGPTARTKAILVVDDDPAMRAYIVTSLAPLWPCLLEAATGDQALELLAASDPGDVALVISDVVMPGLDGLALRAAIHALPGYADLPVLLVTGEAALDPVADGPVLRKPFNARLLRSYAAELTTTHDH
jgi:CheY-like chemotaxis protein